MSPAVVILIMWATALGIGYAVVAIIAWIRPDWADSPHDHLDGPAVEWRRVERMGRSGQGPQEVDRG